jgi:hypothetical protein
MSRGILSRLFHLGRMPEFRHEFSEGDLAPFPVRQGSFAVDPQKVVRLFGSLKKLPDS